MKFKAECDVSVSKLFHFLDGLGFGIERIWYRKKYRIRYRKNLVSKKVSDSVSLKFGIGKNFGLCFVQILGILGEVSVSKLFHFLPSFGFGIEKIWYRKKYRIRYRKNLVSEKSFGFGFVQILGIVTHWL